MKKDLTSKLGRNLVAETNNGNFYTLKMLKKTQPSSIWASRLVNHSTSSPDFQCTDALVEQAMCTFRKLLRLKHNNGNSTKRLRLLNLSNTHNTHSISTAMEMVHMSRSLQPTQDGSRCSNMTIHQVELSMRKVKYCTHKDHTRTQINKADISMLVRNKIPTWINGMSFTPKNMKPKYSRQAIGIQNSDSR